MNSIPMRLKLGHTLWRDRIRPYLFKKEAEQAHRATVKGLAYLQKAHLLPVLRFLFRSPLADELRCGVGDMEWRNPVGIAAGFDKHGEILLACDALGVGAIEVGTVTPRRQSGNCEPRVFRYEEHLAVVNRYGFNSHGAPIVGERITKQLRGRKIGAHVGVSIGPNTGTPLAEMSEACGEALRLLDDAVLHYDYTQINVSSPNTPGLREIFQSGFLDEFFEDVTMRIRQFEFTHHGIVCHPLRYRPIIIKIPPDDMTGEILTHVIALCAKYKIAAIEVTNTTTSEGLKRRYGITERGGLSGEPLRELSTSCLHTMRSAARENGIHLIGVGGISQGEHAIEKYLAGAKAVQVYTGLIWHGPILVHRILEAWKQQAA